MDENSLALDPFTLDESETTLPFAGREEAFALLNHHLNDPPNTGIMTFLGRRRIGKTTILRQFAKQAAASILAVHLPLRQVSFHSESEWLHVLSSALAKTIASQGYTVEDMDTPPDEVHALRDWFSIQCIPAALRAIRHRKRMVLLLDDLEEFMDTAGVLVVPRESFAYLYSLLQSNIGIAVTIDLAFENRLQAFSPLVNIGRIHRLSRLAPQATEALLHDPNNGFNTITDAAVAIVHRETGGEPAFAQHFITCLSKIDKKTISVADAKDAIPAAYANSSVDLNLLWNLFNLNEQRVLSAISSLKYRDPLRPVDTNAIESWLVRTDYPTDTTSINGAVRSMEYNGILEGSAADISIAAGLMHRWLLENADYDSEKVGVSANSRQRIIVGLVVVTIFLLLLLVIRSAGTKPLAETTAVPTAPLSNIE